MSENEHPNSVINALKRLERAGSEESRATEKLREAAGRLGDVIARVCPEDAVGGTAGGYDLPRGYSVYSVGFAADYRHRLQLCSSEPDTPVGADRDSALAFAHDIATGWLDELAAWLEARASESTEATARLERAAEAMR